MFLVSQPHKMYVQNQVLWCSNDTSIEKIVFPIVIGRAIYAYLKSIMIFIYSYIKYVIFLKLDFSSRWSRNLHFVRSEPRFSCFKPCSCLYIKFPNTFEIFKLVS